LFVSRVGQSCRLSGSMFAVRSLLSGSKSAVNDIVYCFPSMHMYCREVDEMPIDELPIEESPRTGDRNYVINLGEDFQTLPERFRLIDAHGFEEFCGSLGKVVAAFGRLNDSRV